MVLYRITNAKYADDLSGNGARLYGGRWNSEGKPMMYLASSRSLAVLESLAYLVPTNIPNNFLILNIEVPDDFLEIPENVLPDNWNEYPEQHILKQIGNSFLQKNEHLLLKVPSALVPEEFNYLMNPLHPKATKAKIVRKTPFNFDERLVGQ
ncbi:RES family NAD+ phosphorylase [Mucilaginibacter sp.]|jgi:RES domain-containing protein|uniref:RES family NAD+ phosphorylase n=1 Tax=Mucilaginibacter sp. TaxID=1882438 RepID=UPI002BAE831D|nr:RES family NAD+ phosphorylase [Mucilaginibacter sp.]HTI61091.1 RES family NAD+ phosphorylase [Mucilaginibacter sp.]